MRDVGEGELAGNAGLGFLRGGQPDYRRASIFQLVGDCGGQRIVTADNDVAMHGDFGPVHQGIMSSGVSTHWH